MKKFYIIADLERDPSAAESSAIPSNGKMYAGKVKAIVSAETWEQAMEAGKRCILGTIKKGFSPFRWGWNEVDFVVENGDKTIYDKYPTATWVAYYRIQAGLTQKALAEKAGVNIRMIQKLEGGEILAENVTAKNLLSIADALGVEMGSLL